MGNEVQTNNQMLIQMHEIEARLIELRGQKVLIDRDVAELYGVETRRVNEAVKNNLEKFPEGYVITLQSAEKQYVVENFDRLGNLDKSPVDQRTGELLSDLIVDEADTLETESSIELNLMAIKFKHTVKRTKK